MSADETIYKYKVELNNHSFAGLTPMISEECDFFHPTGTYHGLEEVQQGLEKGWEAIRDKIFEFSNVEWIVKSDNLAICAYTFYYSGMVRD